MIKLEMPNERATGTWRWSVRLVLITVATIGGLANSCDGPLAPSSLGACRQTGSDDPAFGLGCRILTKTDCNRLGSSRETWEFRGSGTTC